MEEVVEGLLALGDGGLGVAGTALPVEYDALWAFWGQFVDLV